MEVKILNDGTKSWWLNGKLHREDGPAVEYADGTKMWYRNGLPHREDGPAAEYANGTNIWWIKGKYFPNESSYWEIVNRTRDLVWQISSRNLIADPGFANHFLKFVL